ncbi:5-methyltetrahydropteroyltriglutamate--homocysteine S-methyltransferase [Buchnera aphidicola (Hormaphis cornu)]|nr:5-methyltetrahydropteroyltriglutamate--homocysteine S-methyltransferase [Buchnera aphidicola (Hormaphis cornu)]
MILFNHILGFPRIGINRELKQAQENYWQGKIQQSELLSIGKNLRKKNWKQQKQMGIDLLPVGDFSWYDHVLTTTMLLGNIPVRHQNIDGSINIDTLFRIARGYAPTGKRTTASEMTKWFNTNYHYIVPEFQKDHCFKFSWFQLLDEVDEALALGHKIKPILLGPMSYLWLGKVKGIKFDRLELLHKIVPIYQQILLELVKRKIHWVQLDEPILALELPNHWMSAFHNVYEQLNVGLNILLTTFFGSIEHNIEHVVKIPVHGLHIDHVSGNYNLEQLNKKIPQEWLLSVGIINGRNIWKSNLVNQYNELLKIVNIRPQISIGTSCSLLHCPIDITLENNLDIEVKGWFSFALQKCRELYLLKEAINRKDISMLKEWSKPLNTRSTSSRVHKEEVQNRLFNLSSTQCNRDNKYQERAIKQKQHLKLPQLPTTTIGSFPQTDQLRKIRSNFKKGLLSLEKYDQEIANYIKMVINLQEELDIDVLVHGEPERNDMVEYFGENLEGFVFTQNGWVQSYGSRCVKPPIIIGDIHRVQPITLKWTKYAQSITSKPIKGMLTGPITILCWSFPREDISPYMIAKQIALALRDEVLDLEKSGVDIIQIDEPALREGLPLKKRDWKKYLSWATESFRLSTTGIKDTTQIHTHMCYCEFNDIMEAIVQLDADVITIETARSDMELLEFFKIFKYPNEIGPGVYDIHSPNVPTIMFIENLLKKAIKYIPVSRLWVNPDCGLKTRNWKETRLALQNMVQASKNIRKLIN